MRNYYPGITIFKLAGSLLVLFAHVLFFRYAAYIPNQQWQFVFLILRVIVPCFYVVAGFLAYQGWTHAENPRAYVQKYLTRILVMYGLFCLIFVAEHIIPALASGGFSIGNLYLQAKILGAAVFLNGPFIQFWFVPPLVFGIAASYWLYEKRYMRMAVTIALAGFLSSLLLSGTLRTLLAAGSLPSLSSEHLNYFISFITRYWGFGFTFVWIGVLLGKYEKRFVQCKIGRLLIPSLILTVGETLILLRYAEWDAEYKLAFSLLPNTILLFYGILHIKSQAVRTYHKWINRFSVVTFCTHILFMQLNLFVLNWDIQSMGFVQDFAYLVLTLAECLALTYLLAYNENRFAPKRLTGRS